MDFIPISQVEEAIKAEMQRDCWVPMLDATGLRIAYAYRNNQELAWVTFDMEPGSYSIH